LVDYEREIALPDEAGLKAFCEAYKPYWQSWEPGTTPGSDHYVHFKEFSLFDYNFFDMPNLMNNISLAKGMGYEDEYALLPIRALDGGVTAEIECALAVSAASQNQRNAWNFVKGMYGIKTQLGKYYTGASYGLPVLQNTARFICERRAGSHGTIGSGTDSLDQITGALLFPKDWKIVLDLYQSPVDCVIPTSTDVLAIFEECMTPYFSDEASYEESVENLRRKLELYVSE
jgi:hypothetical protein